MTIHSSWRSPFRAMCPPPGPRDQFLAIVINGKRVSVQHVAEYEQWRTAAERLAVTENCNVKVLPMSGSEMMTFFDIKCEPHQPIANLDPAIREEAIKSCMDVLRECADARERGEALDMLNHLGVLQ